MVGSWMLNLDELHSYFIRVWENLDEITFSNFCIHIELQVYLGWEHHVLKKKFSRKLHPYRWYHKLGIHIFLQCDSLLHMCTCLQQLAEHFWMLIWGHKSYYYWISGMKFLKGGRMWHPVFLHFKNGKKFTYVYDDTQSI